MILIIVEKVFNLKFVKVFWNLKNKIIFILPFSENRTENNINLRGLKNLHLKQLLFCKLSQKHNFQLKIIHIFSEKLVNVLNQKVWIKCFRNLETHKLWFYDFCKFSHHFSHKFNLIQSLKNKLIKNSNF